MRSYGLADIPESTEKPLYFFLIGISTCALRACWNSSMYMNLPLGTVALFILCLKVQVHKYLKINNTTTEKRRQI